MLSSGSQGPNGAVLQLMDAMVKTSPKTLVLGLGNAMLSDLGAGIEVIHRLRRRRPRPPDVDLVRVGLVNVSLAQVIGQYANLIVVEQASYFNIEITFKQHAAVGIPVTLLSLAILVGWVAAVR